MMFGSPHSLCKESPHRAMTGHLLDETAQTSEASSEIVADRLAHAIHEHKLRPGTKLSEDEAGDIYGVSRTVVRAALQRLSHDQLVTLKRNRGAFVAQPDLREAREVFEGRALLEPRTARSAAAPADIARLQSHIELEHAALRAGDAGRALRLSGQFHIEIARVAGQDTIRGFITQLVARSSLIIALYWKRRNALCESHAHHALLDAIAKHDGAAAEELMKGHLLDLLSPLDLREAAVVPANLKAALAG